MRSAFLYVLLLHLSGVLTTNGENVGSCIGVVHVCGYRSFRIIESSVKSCKCVVGSTIKLTKHDPSDKNGNCVVYCLKSCSDNDKCTAVGESCIHDKKSNENRCLCSTGYSRTRSSLGHCQVNNITTTSTHSAQGITREGSTNQQEEEHTDTSKAELPKPMSPKPETQNTQNDDNLTLYIGLGVGFASLVVLVAILIVLVVFLRRRTARQSGMTEPENNTRETIRNNISPRRETRVVTYHGYAEINEFLKASDRNDYAPDPSEVPAKQRNLTSYDEIVFNGNVPTVVRAVNNTQNPPSSYPHIEAITDPDSTRPQSFHPYADIDEVMASLKPNVPETSRLGNSKTIDDASGTYNTLYQVRVPKSLGTKEIPAIEDTPATDYGTTDTGRLNQIRNGEKKQETGAIKDRLTTEDPYSNHKIAQEKDRIRAAKKENLESIDKAVEALESADGRPRYSEINEPFNTDESIGTYHTLEEVEVPESPFEPKSVQSVSLHDDLDPVLPPNDLGHPRTDSENSSSTKRVIAGGYEDVDLVNNTTTITPLKDIDQSQVDMKAL